MERFFDEVLVMDEDDAVRANRLRLLLDVRDALGRLGDFSQIPTLSALPRPVFMFSREVLRVLDPPPATARAYPGMTHVSVTRP